MRCTQQMLSHKLVQVVAATLDTCLVPTIPRQRRDTGASLAGTIGSVRTRSPTLFNSVEIAFSTGTTSTKSPEYAAEFVIDLSSYAES